MFEEFLENKRCWLNAQGPDANIVISSRVRLARNIERFFFPSKATTFQKNEVLQRVHQAYPEIGSLSESYFVNMEDLVSIDKQFLLERHLISQEHIHSPKGKGVIITKTETTSIMVNEEDHLRLQVMVSGFDLLKAWEIINILDDELSSKLAFSFSPDIGYYTSCPTNVGTGLRASCMLHLPGLILTKRISRILELLAKLSFATRGLFGEGTQALGNFFQVSNQISLGFTEAEIIENLQGAVRQIKEQEINAREALLKRYRVTLEDSVWRSLGVLRNCRLIATKEALSHLSMLCLGLDLDIIKGIDRELLNNLFIIIQPAHLQKIEGKALKENERDYIRASTLRGRLKN